MPIYKTDKKNKNGIAQYRVIYSYKDAKGKYKKIEKRVFGKSAAQEKLRELEDSIKNSRNVAKLPFDKAYEEYIETISPEIRSSSRTKKMAYYRNHFLPFFRDTDIKEIDTRMVTQWKRYINDKKLSIRTKQNCYKELNACFNYWIKLELLVVNPVAKAGNFRDAYEGKKEMDFYSLEEFNKFNSALLKEAEETDVYDFYVFFNIAFWTGCRKGEIHALRWDRYHDSLLEIKESVNQKNINGYETTPPKNKSSIRDVTVPQQLKTILDEHKQRAMLLPDFTEDKYICGYYKPLADTSIEKKNIKIAKDADLKHIRIHDFRHSHASMLLGNGAPLLAISKRLGHSTVDQTSRTYVHLLKKESDKLVSILDNLATN